MLRVRGQEVSYTRRMLPHPPPIPSRTIGFTLGPVCDVSQFEQLPGVFFLSPGLTSLTSEEETSLVKFSQAWFLFLTSVGFLFSGSVAERREASGI